MQVYRKEKKRISRQAAAGMMLTAAACFLCACGRQVPSPVPGNSSHSVFEETQEEAAVSASDLIFESMVESGSEFYPETVVESDVSSVHSHTAVSGVSETLVNASDAALLSDPAEAFSDEETESVTEQTAALPFSDTDAAENAAGSENTEAFSTSSDHAGPSEKAEEEAPTVGCLHLMFSVLDLSRAALPAPERSMNMLRSQLEQLLSEYDGTWSVYVKNLSNEEEMIIQDRSMPSASTMKLFVMGTVYRCFENKELERTSEVMDLMTRMISSSSNEAANRLISLLGGGSFADGIARINRFIRDEGFSSGTRIFNGFQNDSLILSRFLHNRVNARDCAAFLEEVYHRTFISRKVCNEIEDMMLKQQTRYKIPSGIPDGISVGNKTGETDEIENDTAVVYSPACDYIICIFSHGWKEKNPAQKQVGILSKEVYEFFNSDSYIPDRYPLYAVVEKYFSE